MKKLFVLPVLAVAFVLGTQHITAQESASTEISEAPVVSETQEKYIELAVENLPQPIIDAVTKDYTGATISSAAATQDASEFKLLLTKEGATMEAFCDAAGNWISK